MLISFFGFLRKLSGGMGRCGLWEERGYKELVLNPSLSHASPRPTGCPHLLLLFELKEIKKAPGGRDRKAAGPSNKFT